MYLKEQVILAHALGGDIQIGIVAESAFDFGSTLNKLLQQILIFEKNYSRFLPNSRLTELNQNGSIFFEVDDEFRELLELAKNFSLKTGGVYNPFILPGLQNTGYLASAVKKYSNDPALDYRRRAYYSIDQLKISAEKAFIPLNSAIDLGGCGKGFLLDKIIKNLQSNGDIYGAWVDLSGDIAIFGNDSEMRPISVDIQRAAHNIPKHFIHSKDKPKFIATSGTFSRNGKRISNHHLINPATGRSADTDVILATVASTSGIKADILASCVVILGSQKGQQMLDSLGISNYLIQYQGSSAIKYLKKGQIFAEEQAYAY